MLGGVGLTSVWTKSLAPRIQDKVTKPVYEAINTSVLKILHGDKGTLIAVAALLLVWHMTAAVATVMEALNRMHDVDDKRRWRRKLVVALALAAVITLCVVCALLVVSTAPKLGGGALHFVLGSSNRPGSSKDQRGTNPFPTTENAVAHGFVEP